MASSKINLNLFGEIVNIEPPSNLIELREKISENFVLNKSDAEELILSYTKESKSINIEKEEDYKIFLESKINQIKIDISQNSHIYQENLSKLKEEKENDEKKLNELLKQNEEYKKLLSTKFINQKQEIIDITKQIQELFSKRKKLIQYIKVEKGKIIKLKKNNDKAIIELQKKLDLKTNKVKMENDSILYKKKKFRRFKKYNKKRENIIQNKNYYRTLSKEKRKNSPLSTNEISIQSYKNNNKMNIKRKTSPLLGQENKEKKVININDSKNNMNPFYEEKEESKGQKQKFVKIAEIICNTIKSIKNITNKKKEEKINVPVLPDKKVKNFRINKNEKIQMEENNESKKNIEKKNEIGNNLINKHQKYENLLSLNKEKPKNLSVKKNDEKKNENNKINIKSNIIKKEMSLKNNKK